MTLCRFTSDIMRPITRFSSSAATSRRPKSKGSPTRSSGRRSRAMPSRPACVRRSRSIARRAVSNSRMRAPASRRCIAITCAPSYITADKGDAEALELMMKIVAQGATSRLYQKLVVEDKWRHRRWLVFWQRLGQRQDRDFGCCRRRRRARQDRGRHRSGVGRNQGERSDRGRN